MDISNIIQKNSNRVFFFSLPECYYCDKLQRELELFKIPFVKILLTKDTDMDAIEQLKQLTNQRTFPQLYIGSEFVGGYDAWTKLGMTNQIKALLEKIGIAIEDDF